MNQQPKVRNFLQSQGTLVLFSFTVPDLWGTNTCLITTPISSTRCIEIPQDQKSISPGALINHRLERGIECVLHGEITRLSRSICRDQGNDTQGLMNPQSHNYTLIDGSYLDYHGSQLIGHSFSNSLVVLTIRATRPIVGVTTRHDFVEIRSPNLRECCNTDVQTLELR